MARELPPHAPQFLQTAGASAGALAGLDELAVAKADDRPNVLLIIVDTLRADHSFGKRARTPYIDALAREGLSFTSFYPEAMPTVPARRSILSGRRVFPFRGWHPYPGLLAEPGLGADRRRPHHVYERPAPGRLLVGVCNRQRRARFSPPWRPFRNSFDRFVRRGGQIGGTAAGVSDREVHHWLPREIEDPDTYDRIKRYLANGHHSHDETQSFAARVFRDASRVLERPSRNVRSPWWSTPSSRTSRGRRRATTWICTATGLPRPRARAPPTRRHALPARPPRRGPARAHEGAVRSGSDDDRRWLGVFLDRFHELKLNATRSWRWSRPRLLPGRLRLHGQDRQRRCTRR